MILTEMVLREYASLRGWPSQSEWNTYAKEKGYLGVQGIYYHTRKNWNDYRDLLGFLPRAHRFSKEECLDAIRMASKELGQFFTRKQYEEWQKLHPTFPNHQVISGRCGGWNIAKVSVGLLPNDSWGKEFTEEEIIDSLRKCSKSLGPLFSEEEYMAWRSKNPDTPSIETIRKRLGGLPEAKRKMGLESYDAGGPEFQYSEGRWREPFLRFLRDQLTHTAYEGWLRENEGPGLKALTDHAGGYEKSLLECLRLFIEKVESGRRKR